jgi:hypothetical protein
LHVELYAGAGELRWSIEAMSMDGARFWKAMVDGDKFFNNLVLINSEEDLPLISK